MSHHGEDAYERAVGRATELETALRAIERIVRDRPDQTAALVRGTIIAHRLSADSVSDPKTSGADDQGVAHALLPSKDGTSEAKLAPAREPEEAGTSLGRPGFRKVLEKLGFERAERCAPCGGFIIDGKCDQCDRRRPSEAPIPEEPGCFVTASCRAGKHDCCFSIHNECGCGCHHATPGPEDRVSKATAPDLAWAKLWLDVHVGPHEAAAERALDLLVSIGRSTSEASPKPEGFDRLKARAWSDGKCMGGSDRLSCAGCVDDLATLIAEVRAETIEECLEECESLRKAYSKSDGGSEGMRALASCKDSIRRLGSRLDYPKTGGG